MELRSPEVLAGLAFNYGTTPAGFGMNTAELLGLGDLRQKSATDIAKMPRRDLTLILQGIALRVMKGDTAWRHDDRTDAARQQLAAECAEDFRILMSAVSGPELTNAGRLQVRAGSIAALWDEVEGLIRRQEEGEAGAFADELGENGPAWAETVRRSGPSATRWPPRAWRSGSTWTASPTRTGTAPSRTSAVLAARELIRSGTSPHARGVAA